MAACPKRNPRYATLLLSTLAMVQLLAGCSRSPQQKLADQFAQLVVAMKRGQRIDSERMAWEAQHQPSGPGRQEYVYFEQRFHELMDARFGGPSNIRYGREQHVEMVNELLRKYHPETLERLKRGDYGVDGITGEPGGDPKDIVLCYPTGPDNRGDGTAPVVSDKAKACADFYADYVEQEVAAPFKMKSVVKVEQELSEATEQAGKLLWNVNLEEWSNGGGPKGFDLPAEIRGLLAKYHPEAVDDFNDLIRYIMTGNTVSVQNEAKQDLLSIWRAERDFREQDLDKNGVHDFWTADVSGLSRLHADGEAAPISNRNVAGCDDAPLPAGGLLGSSPVVPHIVRFHFHMLKFDGNGDPFGVDTDGSGKAWHNLQHFAVCAYPAGYGRAAGRQTYLVDEKMNLWSKDTDGLPLDRFPKDPEADGWSAVKDPDADSERKARAIAGAQKSSNAETPTVVAETADSKEVKRSKAFDKLLFSMECPVRLPELMQQQHLILEEPGELADLVIAKIDGLWNSNESPTRQGESLINYLAELGPRLAKTSSKTEQGQTVDNRSAAIELLSSIVQDQSHSYNYKYASVAANALYRITGDAKPLHYLQDIYLREIANETNLHNERIHIIITQLGRLGAEATDSIPYLNYIFRNKSYESCQLDAACALARITGKPDPGLGFIVRQLESDLNTYDGLAYAAGGLIDRLEDLGPLARPATPTLFKIIDYQGKNSEEAKIAAAGVIVCGGQEPSRGLETLRTLIGSGFAEAALKEVAHLGPLAIALAPTLTETMNSDKTEPAARVWAAFALVRVTGEAEPGLGFIIKNMDRKDTPPFLVSSCVISLGRLGRIASDALVPLGQLSLSYPDSGTGIGKEINIANSEIETGIINEGDSPGSYRL